MGFESICLWIGVALGLGAAALGISRPKGWFSAIASGIAAIVSFLTKDKDPAGHAKAILTLASEYRVNILVQDFATGFLLGMFVTMILGALAVYVTSHVRFKRKGLPDAFALAARRASHLFFRGVLDYMDKHSVAAQEAREKWLETRIQVSDVAYRTLAHALCAGPLTEQRFEDLMQQWGGVFLGRIYDGDESVAKRFRMTIYRGEPNGDLSPVVTVSRDQPAGRIPLSRKKSFLGSVLDEGKTRVWPRDKKKRNFEQRAQNRYNSFVAVPLPKDRVTGVEWGFSIDHEGDDSVFCQERLDATADFANFLKVARACIH